MSEYNVPFTDEDHRILSSCVTLVEGLADYLGGGYEIVLHSLEDVEHSVVKIINGHHTGRTTGAPITDLALSMLSRIENENGRAISPIFQEQKGRAAQGCHHRHPRRGRAYHRAAVHQFLPQHAAFASSGFAVRSRTAEPCGDGDLR